MKVLIIDDDADIRFVAAMSLRAGGTIDVVEASGGLDGVRKAREEQPDVILLDMMMPMMDGSQTIAALRMQSETATTPVIFGTATRPDMMPMALLPTAMAIRAVAMGRLMATREPKAMARMTIAIRMPISSLLPPAGRFA